ncbi:oxygen-insensitive NADPH nitroreductase [Phocicoccus pinnipedialis]|uniref:FMN reductase (NADPH) n=1 Tax=Phocicoccus pinnipedialis TaxID=110845 RepID=A0A6V7RLC5_9BACL|nr:oxygen-insensitive NADPH nitroreductase [Jeotgalicoccus pinnipedialis]MBP1939617.1 FMN reductase (NADPH) [Jeotgalicoccus pinnipedialis]CAD2078976.1 FMN reductase (NADPH) [Jeotgalicoccus pinnipedialis]
MNETIKLLQNHRSLRKFEERALDQDTIHILIKSAQQASTSSYVQAYSIIGITDPEKKKAIREISTQAYVEYNGHLFIFVVDYNRHKQLASRSDYEIKFNSTESLLVGIVDAALAAENMAIAAESMGLGIVFLGSIRNDAAKMIEILNLPEGTFPIFGMAVGYPVEEGSFKERLPLEAVYFENEYPEFEEVKESLNDYDETVTQYYKTREENKRNDKWSRQVMKTLSKKERLDVHDVLKNQGFLGQ